MTSTTPPPPRAAERVADMRPRLWRIEPSTAVLTSLLAGGLAFDLGVRHPAGALSLVAVGLVAAAGLWGGWVRGPLARRLLALSLAPAAMLTMRDSRTLTLLNVAAVGALLLLAVVVRAEPHPVSRAVGRLVHPIAAVEPATMSIHLVADSARAARAGHDLLGRRTMRILRGLAMGIPVAAVLAALLAAADALFRSWFGFPVDVDTLVAHTFVVAVGIAVTMALAGHGAWAEPRPPGSTARWIGPTEAAVVLAGIVLVYAGFVASQVVAIAAGADYVEQTTGLTYAEYARAGFFQLVAAAVVTLLTLAALRRYRRRSSPRMVARTTALELATVVLTLIAVAVAIRRLFLYEAEFGLTLLRVGTIVFALFVGFVFIVIGLSITGHLRHDVVAVVATGALVTLLAVNVANPERIVASRNIERFGGTDQLDVDYLVENLGADAMPAMLEDPVVAARLCALAPAVDDRTVSFNWSRARAADALAGRCG